MLAFSPLGVLAAEEEAASDPAPVSAPQSPYRVQPALDLGLTIGSGAVLILPRLLIGESAGPWCGLECDPHGINGLDRTVLGNHSGVAASASDATAAVCIALPVLLDGLDVLLAGGGDGWLGYGQDMLVTLETAAITMGLYSLLNLAVRRPRPLVYDETRTDGVRTRADAAMSFPSGHTAISFSMATTAAYTFTMRHPDSPWVAPVWIGALGLASATGVLRTEAGRHFWTDVLAGAALGAGLGLLVPYLHLRDDSGSGGRGAGESELRVELGPVLLPGGAGAVLTLR